MGEEGWRVRKAGSIVKLLALAPSHRLDREALVDTLWPDFEPASGANNLRVALHAARTVLGEGAIVSRGNALELGSGRATRVDIEAFEQAAALALRSKEPGASVAAADLYVGDLLPEDRYADWTVVRRERLRDLFHAVLEHAVALHDVMGDLEAARLARERLVECNPTHEPARVWLMRSYAASGLRQRALRHYQELAAALRSELDVEPEAATVRLQTEIAGR